MEDNRVKGLMRTIFNEYQPVVPVMKDVNPDEFDPEIEIISKSIDKCKTLQDVHELVYRTFLKSFESDAGPKEKYLKMSKDLYSQLLENKSKEWYKKGKEVFPDIIYGDGLFHYVSSIYGLWFDLLPLTRNAHKKEDDTFLKKVYDFAEWCYFSREEGNSNAVMVSFYEDLVDNDETMRKMVKWVSMDIVKAAIGLWEFRLSKSKERYENLIQYLKSEGKLPKDYLGAQKK
jgi:hypothetical protein